MKTKANKSRTARKRAPAASTTKKRPRKPAAVKSRKTTARAPVGARSRKAKTAIKRPTRIKRVRVQQQMLDLSRSVEATVAVGTGGAETRPVRDLLTRTLGVLRLTDDGNREVFVPVLEAGTPMPQTGEQPITKTVMYSPRHNIGHLQYLECVSTDEQGRPASGVRNLSNVLFPYDPGIPTGARLLPDAIVQRDDLADRLVRETYTCDHDGVISLHISRLSDGYSAVHEIYRHGAPPGAMSR